MLFIIIVLAVMLAIMLTRRSPHATSGRVTWLVIGATLLVLYILKSSGATL